jgi:hypothetical protein
MSRLGRSYSSKAGTSTCGDRARDGLVDRLLDVFLGNAFSDCFFHGFLNLLDGFLLFH